ncbi:hypothetical protein L5515_012414 [Caenorhabditis briggsae]|uniref:Uncharacterized protein n=1 Tax=Caenorhabditis briggsae TaxID=6238 RepID=A0AAE9EVW7_CAEBR|nr:hypothetical protein L5515_012414 [Caenorhabditis briggsae]
MSLRFFLFLLFSVSSVKSKTNFHIGGELYCAYDKEFRYQVILFEWDPFDAHDLLDTSKRHTNWENTLLKERIMTTDNGLLIFLPMMKTYTYPNYNINITNMGASGKNTVFGPNRFSGAFDLDGFMEDDNLEYNY